eukprot:365746-Chlamydomonas_euryale.AAC.4
MGGCAVVWGRSMGICGRLVGRWAGLAVVWGRSKGIVGSWWVDGRGWTGGRYVCVLRRGRACGTRRCIHAAACLVRQGSSTDKCCRFDGAVGGGQRHGQVLQV